MLTFRVLFVQMSVWSVDQRVFQHVELFYPRQLHWFDDSNLAEQCDQRSWRRAAVAARFGHCLVVCALLVTLFRVHECVWFIVRWSASQRAPSMPREADVMI